MAITPDGKTLYVADADTVIPVSTATNTPGKPIRFDDQVSGIIITPDGRTLYVFDFDGVMTPVSTATNTPGKPVPVVAYPNTLAMSPDAKTFYVAAGNFGQDLVPISTATNTPGKPINVPDASAIAVTPDGKTAYVSSQPQPVKCAPATVAGFAPGASRIPRPQVGRTRPPQVGHLTCTGPPGEVTPISTATNTPGRPVKVGLGPGLFAITPDGKTIYVISENGVDGMVTPITTATDTAGKPVKVEEADAIVITP
jgi:DNA-binding beta-propeller fold protein YncE